MVRIPPGFNTVAPYFFVDDAEGFLRFLAEGLGGEETGRHIVGGRIANAQVRLGTSTVMVSQAVPQRPAMGSAFDLQVAEGPFQRRSLRAAHPLAIR